MNASRDYCPVKPAVGHSFYDFTYWGYKHPRCNRCGFEDETRTLVGPGDHEDDDEDDEDGE